MPRSFDLADTSLKDNSQPATARDHVSVERTDSAVSEQDRDPIRRSECSRRAPGKFTYPQLGNPFISFAQTILEGFDRALVEAFESNPSFEKENIKGLMSV